MVCGEKIMNKEEQKLRGFYPVITTHDNVHNNTQLEEMAKQLEKHIIDCYIPPSTRWRRNYTARAEWFFLWNPRIRKDDQTHAFLISTSGLQNSFYSQWANKFLPKDFEKEYECKFTAEKLSLEEN